MATELAKAYVQIIPSAEGISGNISSILNGEASKAGASSGKAYSSSFGSGIKKGLSVVGGAAAAAATGLAAVGKSIVSNAKDTAAYGDNIDKLSQKIGISAEAFQEWDYVFSQNGTDIGILQTGMKKLSDSVTDAAGGSKSAVAKFDALGLSIKDLKGLSQEDLFATVIQRLQEMPQSAERTAAAADLLGKSATELGPLLNQTAADTDALKQQAHDLGMVMSDDAVKASAAFTDSMDNLQRAFTGAKNKVGAEFLPALTEITNGFANLVAGNEGATEQLKSGFQQLGQSINKAIPSVIKGLTGIVDAVASIAPEIIQTLGAGILQALPQLTSSLSAILPQLITVLLSLAPQLVDVGLQMIVELGNGIAQALPDLVPQIVDAVLQIVDAFLNNLPAIIECGVQIILALVDGILKALPELISRLPEIINQIVEALIQCMPILIQASIQLVNGIVQALPEIITALVEAIPEIITVIVEALTDPGNIAMIIEGMMQLTIAIVAAFPQIIAALVQAIPQIITAIVQAFMPLATELPDVFAQAIEACAPSFNKLGETANQSWNKIKSIFSPVVAWFSGKFNDAVEAIKKAFNGLSDFFKSLWDQIKAIFADVASSFVEVGANIVNGIKEGISGAWEGLANSIKEKVSGLVSAAKEAVGGGEKSAQEAGKKVSNAVAEGITSGAASINNALSTMTDSVLYDGVQASVDAINTMNYQPSYVNGNDRAYSLLAEYLPLIAQGMKVDVSVNQSSDGTFNLVREANNKFVKATGFKALA